MKKTKILFIIWAIIVLIIIGLLTALGFILENRYEKYKELEDKLVSSAKEYAHSEILLEEGEIIVTTEELIEQEYLDSLEVDDDVCQGYVVITNDGTYEYAPYITCKGYTTRNFLENK